MQEMMKYVQLFTGPKEHTVGTVMNLRDSVARPVNVQGDPLKKSFARTDLRIKNIKIVTMCKTYQDCHSAETVIPVNDQDCHC